MTDKAGAIIAAIALCASLVLGNPAPAMAEPKDDQDTTSVPPPLVVVLNQHGNTDNSPILIFDTTPQSRGHVPDLMIFSVRSEQRHICYYLGTCVRKGQP